MNLGAFHDILRISATQRFVEILNHHLVLYLIPIIPVGTQVNIQSSWPPTPTPTPTEEGVLHLDHLQIHDVTSVVITPKSLSLVTRQGSFNWKVYPPCSSSRSRWMTTPCSPTRSPPS